ncbi:MAG: hypothetical protein JJ863_17760 [Deltaproteobacteria bacterium]|nr:hypothetical protein [Deltaproteobacteria bacterium]
MDIPCPSCGTLVPSDELVHEIEGPPLCKKCTAIEMVRRGPRRPSVSTRRTSSGTSENTGSFTLGFVLGFFCCPSLLGLLVPGWGTNTKKGIVVGFVIGLIAGFAIEAYREAHGLPPLHEYWRNRSANPGFTP